MDTEVFDFLYKCDLTEGQGHQNDINMYSLVIFIITPSLKEIGLQMSECKQKLFFKKQNHIITGFSPLNTEYSR